MQDTDLFADMGSTAVADAWQWLPLKARVTLVHFLAELPHLAGQLSNSPENREKLDGALQHLMQVDSVTAAERHALKVATELVVCGEEVSTATSKFVVAVSRTGADLHQNVFWHVLTNVTVLHKRCTYFW